MTMRVELIDEPVSQQGLRVAGLNGFLGLLFALHFR